jgi:hypothetical protein
MNPEHIVSARTEETACELIARLWKQEHGTGSPPTKKSATYDEDQVWRNHADATEELVIAEEDIPTSMEDEMPEWRVMDYFSLLPEVQSDGDLDWDQVVAAS